MLGLGSPGELEGVIHVVSASGASQPQVVPWLWPFASVAMAAQEG